MRPLVEKIYLLSAEGFDKYGDVYAFHWLDAIREDLQKALRAEVLHLDLPGRSETGPEEVLVQSEAAHKKARQRLVESGISEGLLEIEYNMPISY